MSDEFINLGNVDRATAVYHLEGKEIGFIAFSPSTKAESGS